MASLPALPLEVFHLVTNHLQLADIESLSESCKALYLMTAQPIGEHRKKLKQKYNKISFGEHENATSSHPIYFLRDLILDPKLRNYPTKLRLGELLDYEPYLLDEEETEVHNLIQEFGDDFRSLVSKCSSIKGVEKDTWHSAIMEAQGEAILGLLVCLLPNLLSITFDELYPGLFKTILESKARAYILKARHVTRAIL